MRTIAQINEDIDFIKELLAGDLSAEEKKDFEETLENLNSELSAVSSVGSSSKKTEKKSEKAQSKKSNKKIDGILNDIKDIEELLAGDLSAEEKKDFEETLDDLREQLKEETEKVSEKAEEKISQSENNKKEAPAKPKGKRGRPAKSKPSVSEAPAKPKGKRGRPAKAKPSVSEAPKKQEKSKVESSKTIIVVGKKEYDIEDCKQAILALKARKKQSAKTAKKYKTKKPAVKAAGSIETAIHQVSSAVTEKAEGNPKQVIATFREFKKKMNEAFTVLGKIISKSDVELLKKSLKDIDDVIEKYK